MCTIDYIESLCTPLRQGLMSLVAKSFSCLLITLDQLGLMSAPVKCFFESYELTFVQLFPTSVKVLQSGCDRHWVPSEGQAKAVENSRKMGILEVFRGLCSVSLKYFLFSLLNMGFFCSVCTGCWKRNQFLLTWLDIFMNTFEELEKTFSKRVEGYISSK